MRLERKVRPALEEIMSNSQGVNNAPGTNMNPLDSLC